MPWPSSSSLHPPDSRRRRLGDEARIGGALGLGRAESRLPAHPVAGVDLRDHVGFERQDAVGQVVAARGHLQLRLVQAARLERHRLHARLRPEDVLVLVALGRRRRPQVVPPGTRRDAECGLDAAVVVDAELVAGGVDRVTEVAEQHRSALPAELQPVARATGEAVLHLHLRLRGRQTRRGRRAADLAPGERVARVLRAHVAVVAVDRADGDARAAAVALVVRTEVGVGFARRAGGDVDVRGTGLSGRARALLRDVAAAGGRSTHGAGGRDRVARARLAGDGRARFVRIARVARARAAHHRRIGDDVRRTALPGDAGAALVRIAEIARPRAADHVDLAGGVVRRTRRTRSARARLVLVAEGAIRRRRPADHTRVGRRIVRRTGGARRAGAALVQVAHVARAAAADDAGVEWGVVVRTRHAGEPGAVLVRIAGVARARTADGRRRGDVVRRTPRAGDAGTVLVRIAKVAGPRTTHRRARGDDVGGTRDTGCPVAKLVGIAAVTGAEAARDAVVAGRVVGGTGGVRAGAGL